MFNDDYLATVNKCENGWRVVCSIPTDIILQENKYLATFTYIIGIIVAIVCITAGIILISKITNPVSGIMDDLQMQANIDKLSGLLNKITFEETTTQILTNKKMEQEYALVLLDIDNFKSINDNLGHSYGDDVICKMGKLLKKEFNNDT